MLFTLKFISYLVSIKSTYIAYKKKITNFIIESYLVSFSWYHDYKSQAFIASTFPWATY